MESQDLQLIAERLNLSITPEYIRKLTGGDINEVFLIESGDERIVVKKNREKTFPGMLEKEFRALKFLANNTTIHYPEPMLFFIAEGFQYLLLEYIKPGKNTERGQALMGRQLAKQHAISDELFGWDEANYIGSLPQPNRQMEDWSSFYAENRLLFQTKMAYDNGVIDSYFTTKMERFCGKLPGLFPEERPALLHGDLWGGNYFIGENNHPVLYDPAVYFGHREMDIAMTRLFGGFSPSFYLSYNEEKPLESGWEERLSFGQLYPNLVHLNLFGQAYMGAVKQVIDRF